MWVIELLIEVLFRDMARSNPATLNQEDIAVD